MAVTHPTRPGHPHFRSRKRGWFGCFRGFLSRIKCVGVPPQSLESLCGRLTDRLKGPAMRWDTSNAEAMMTLAGLYHNGAWDTYWEAVQAASSHQDLSSHTWSLDRYNRFPASSAAARRSHCRSTGAHGSAAIASPQLRPGGARSDAATTELSCRQKCASERRNAGLSRWEIGHE